MKWKTCSSEYLSKHEYFTARKDKCETPDGTIVPEYYVVELPTSVCALAITEDKKAILVKQYRHPLGKVLIEIPGGFIDEGEEPKLAIVRELLEETGHEFSNIEEVGYTTANPGVLNNYTKLYLATGGKKVAEQKLDFNEDIEMLFVPVDELINMVVDNKIEQSMHVNCIFYSLLRMGNLKFNI